MSILSAEHFLTDITVIGFFAQAITVVHYLAYICYSQYTPNIALMNGTTLQCPACGIRRH